MTRPPAFNSPFLLGFDRIERLLDVVTKSANDGYPPCNIEHIDERRLRITLAVAGFSPDDIAVTLENNQLVIRGTRPEPEETRSYLHRGIAARQFQRKFVLAEGMEVAGATLADGLLDIDLVRPEPESVVRTIPIRAAARSGG